MSPRLFLGCQKQTAPIQLFGFCFLSLHLAALPLVLLVPSQWRKAKKKKKKSRTSLHKDDPYAYCLRKWRAMSKHSVLEEFLTSGLWSHKWVLKTLWALWNSVQCKMSCTCTAIFCEKGSMLSADSKMGLWYPPKVPWCFSNGKEQRPRNPSPHIHTKTQTYEYTCSHRILAQVLLSRSI